MGVGIFTIFDDNHFRSHIVSIILNSLSPTTDDPAFNLTSSVTILLSQPPPCEIDEQQVLHHLVVSSPYEFYVHFIGPLNVILGNAAVRMNEYIYKIYVCMYMGSVYGCLSVRKYVK